MNAAQLINPNIPPVSPTDSVSEVLDRMDDLGQFVLPVVSETTFKGMVTQNQLFNITNSFLSLNDVQIRMETAYVRNYQHFLDVLRCCHNNGINLAAVLGDGDVFMGTVSSTDIANMIGGIYGVQNPGSTLVISMDERDYSLSQIARLAESNGVKILHSSVDTIPDEAGRILLTLKLNHVDPSRVIATLERFGYTITEQFGQMDAPSIDQDRLDMLLKYLNI